MHIPYSSHSAGGKTCLVVAYWAPWLNIPGSIRYRKLFSRLERHGWEIRLLTVGSARDCLRYGDPERCLAVPLLTARRLTSGKAAACAIPGLASRLPIHRVKAALSLLVRRVPVPRTYGWFRQWPRILAWSRRMAPDLILSTSPPPSAHWLAKALAAKLGKPWVAELRDPWVDNHYYQKSGVFYDLELWLERKLLASSDALITVSPQIAANLAARHGKPVKVIDHCFEGRTPGSCPDGAPETAGRFDLAIPLTILYTGRLYPPFLMPGMLLEALDELRRSGVLRPGDIKLVFYTPSRAMLSDWLAREYAPLQGYCELHDPVSNEQALQLQRNCDLLLALGWFGPRGQGVVTSKLGEYLGTGRPILAIASPDSRLSDILDSVANGFPVHSAKACAALLSEFLRLARRGAHLRPQSASLERYSCREQASRLSQFLNEVADHHASM
ncbi:glycosyltransferase [Desulfoferula mesophila]